MQFINPFTKTDLVQTEAGLLQNNQIVFPLTNGAIRVLETEDNYTESFGFQWNKFVKTQIDQDEKNISKERFFIETGWGREDLTGKNILEVGSGAGRFSSVILQHTQANLYSVDYSNAVEANFKNNPGYGDRFNLYQASIYDMPFAPAQFDKVVCLGVLQHTPNFEKSIEALCSMVKPGGELVIDFYPIKNAFTKICAKYILRPYTTKMDHGKLLKKIERNIDWMISATHLLHKIKLGALTRFIPIIDIYGTLPYQSLTKAELKEWAILDTFDQYSPQHDHPQKLSTVTQWVKNNGLKISLSAFLRTGNSMAPVIRAVKPV